MRFKDKVAIVTGSGRGIGKAIALRLAEEGAKVVVIDKNLDTAKSTTDVINKNNGRAITIVADVTRNEEAQRIARMTIEQFGTVDILVNNVGWFTVEPYMEAQEVLWDKIIDINLKSTILCCRPVLEEMIKKRYGKIVNISSGSGRAGTGYQTTYSAAKAGVIGFTKALAREMARHKINVNCICPGVIGTELSAEVGTDLPKIKEALTRGIPWKEYGKPEDVAAAVCFLASDDSRYITGQTLSVDGGLTMH